MMFHENSLLADDSHVAKFVGKKNQRDITWKLREGEQSFLSMIQPNTLDGQ